jgi:hypothetical protein
MPWYQVRDKRDDYKHVEHGVNKTAMGGVPVAVLYPPIGSLVARFEPSRRRLSSELFRI